MQVTIELGSLPDDGYNLKGAAYLRTAADEMDDITPPGGGAPRYGAADVLRLVADAVEAQEPIKPIEPGVYRARAKGSTSTQFVRWSGVHWETANGYQTFVGYYSRSDFEVLEFIGEARDD